MDHRSERELGLAYQCVQLGRLHDLGDDGLPAGQGCAQEILGKSGECALSFAEVLRQRLKVHHLKNYVE